MLLQHDITAAVRMPKFEASAEFKLHLNIVHLCIYVLFELSKCMHIASVLWQWNIFFTLALNAKL